MGTVAEQIIVGAGLSGLVAAINLAGQGRRVRVLEKYKTVGGQPERWPAVDVTPMLPDRMSDYIEIPIGEPQVKPCRRLVGYFWGERHQVPIEESTLCCVERGSRETALDGYLYRLAESLGVQFEFEHPVLGQGEIAKLPPDTIIATGLYAETFDALGIPYRMGWCYGAKGRSERDGEAAVYFGDYTTDYAYWAALNGISMIFFFKMGPIRTDELTDFEREIEETEGIEVGEWLYGYGPTPIASFNNPRLFASDKILAGTLSGMIEPFFFFGVHGALVSGKIASIAVADRAAAFREFRRCLYGWKRRLLSRRFYQRMPAQARRTATRGLNRRLENLSSRWAGKVLSGGFRSVPGYRIMRGR